MVCDLTSVGGCNNGLFQHTAQYDIERREKEWSVVFLPMPSPRHSAPVCVSTEQGGGAGFT